VIKAKRSLGQNFLIDQNVIDKIINIIDIKDRNVLEIGPGTGSLTQAIIDKNPKKLLVVEKDNDLASLLEKNFKNKIKIINEDILKIDERLLDSETLTVFGNLPYNISTEILCKWILNINNQNFWFDYLILMFQKEVADRIIAEFNSKNYGRLSILSHWKLDIKKICDVKPTSFSPKPKIDSSVLFFKPRKEIFKLENPKNLEMVTRTFFMHRRKMIKKPYNQLFKGETEVALRLKINLNLRPQNLDFETYFKITNEYEKLKS
jgi:16S rRNA (adenine1518-N6/adenine1519-N6)-dimethyltransferase